MGKMVEVEIESAGKHYMHSQLVSEARRPENVPPPLKQGQVSGLNNTLVSVDSHLPRNRDAKCICLALLSKVFIM